jgi:hypothetical protein
MKNTTLHIGTTWRWMVWFTLHPNLTLGVLWIAGLEHPRAGLDMVAKRENIAPNGNRIPVVQFFANHCLKCSGSQSYSLAVFIRWSMMNWMPNNFLVLLNIWKQYVECHFFRMLSEFYVYDNYAYHDIAVFVVVTAVLRIRNVMREIGCSDWFSSFRPNRATIWTKNSR